MELKDRIQRTKHYLSDFERFNFPYQECVASVERSRDESRKYLSYALGNGFAQEELTTLVILHNLTWDDPKWTLDFISKNAGEMTSKPKIKKAFKHFYDNL